MFRTILLFFIVYCSFTIGSRASTETSAMETIDAGRVEKSLAKLNITSQTKIHDLVPGSDQLKDVYTAYDPSFIKQEIDIFKLTVVETTTKFFVRIEFISFELNTIFRQNILFIFSRRPFCLILKNENLLTLKISINEWKHLSIILNHWPIQLKMN